jgi:putative CocE/NonD family hydrolase
MLTAVSSRRLVFLVVLLVLTPFSTFTLRARGEETRPVREQYVKREYRISMRDGARLFTAVYTPRDASPEKRYPILMARTCYSIRPYGEDRYRSTLGPNRRLQRDGYIFVYQDVRGCYMSEGRFVNMTPHIANKKSKQDVDESTDTYDTIEWLLKNVKHHNNRVGQWGISYRGFYAAAGMIDAHPALKAVSPQAPIADWWYDDFHHHGAFFLPHAFNFLANFGQPRPQPTTHSAPRFDHGSPDGYQFFLDLGSLKNANPRHFRDRVRFWNEIIAHPNYDDFWQARNLLPHLKSVAPAVMVVGGWFDAEDLYGPLQIYRTIEADNPDVENMLVMGPWAHGAWAKGAGDHLGNVYFGSKTAEFYRQWIETKFFKAYLKGEGQTGLPEAYVFETGANRWRMFDAWPPRQMEKEQFYLAAGEELAREAPAQSSDAFDQFVSDPNKPVPFTASTAIGMTREYMTEDQRFAARRPDVLAYQTKPLTEDVTLCGPLLADLYVSTSQGDADWVVKLIDVFPPSTENHRYVAPGQHMGGYQMMVRSEVIRGRFRDDPSRPEPFKPDQVTKVHLPLQDVLHTFKTEHRIMIQIQSTWFPLVDRNPQKYVDNVFLAEGEDFVEATHRVYRSAEHPSIIEAGVLPQ